MACAICQTRRPRRFCPGVRGDICTLCCGAEREVTVDCPLQCEYLIEAHKHEKPLPIDPETLPNRDIPISEDFVEKHQELFMSLAHGLVEMANQTPGAADRDAREALEAAIRTHRTLQTGLVYESVPANPLAATLYRALEAGIEEWRKFEAEQTGIHKTRESDVLGMLVFVQQLEYTYNNGRPRGRAFLQMLDSSSPHHPDSGPSPESPLILPRGLEG